ncbi:MAG: low molecular weight phosphotyrosine protein phosphatase [Rikenellaceae bacterium]|jgi:protein-tyrosine phosphatase|nr:low molecular weight phosphotyrosine protein phosphatase [Rikenellaceae bacterium]
MDTKLLFVCLGNICRSPAAEGIMKHIVAEKGLGAQFKIDSAGTYGGHAGEMADPRMRQAASRRGYNLTSRSRPIRTDDFERFDRIVVMDDSNYERVHRIAPSREAAQKIYRMTDFCTRHPNADHVPDPYYEGQRGFEIVLDLLEDACEGLLEDIQKEK